MPQAIHPVAEVGQLVPGGTVAGRILRMVGDGVGVQVGVCPGHFAAVVEVVAHFRIDHEHVVAHVLFQQGLPDGQAAEVHAVEFHPHAGDFAVVGIARQRVHAAAVVKVKPLRVVDPMPGAGRVKMEGLPLARERRVVIDILIAMGHPVLHAGSRSGADHHRHVHHVVVQFHRIGGARGVQGAKVGEVRAIHPPQASFLTRSQPRAAAHHAVGPAVVVEFRADRGIDGIAAGRRHIVGLGRVVVDIGRDVGRDHQRMRVVETEVVPDFMQDGAGIRVEVPSLPAARTRTGHRTQARRAGVDDGVVDQRLLARLVEIKFETVVRRIDAKARQIGGLGGTGVPRRAVRLRRHRHIHDFDVKIHLAARLGGIKRTQGVRIAGQRVVPHPIASGPIGGVVHVGRGNVVVIQDQHRLRALRARHGGSRPRKHPVGIHRVGVGVSPVRAGGAGGDRRLHIRRQVVGISLPAPAQGRDHRGRQHQVPEPHPFQDHLVGIDQHLISAGCLAVHGKTSGEERKVVGWAVVILVRPWRGWSETLLPGSGVLPQGGMKHKKKKEKKRRAAPVIFCPASRGSADNDRSSHFSLLRITSCPAFHQDSADFQKQLFFFH